MALAAAMIACSSAAHTTGTCWRSAFSASPIMPVALRQSTQPQTCKAAMGATCLQGLSLAPGRTVYRRLCPDLSCVSRGMRSSLRNSHGNLLRSRAKVQAENVKLAYLRLTCGRCMAGMTSLRCSSSPLLDEFIKTPGMCSHLPPLTLKCPIHSKRPCHSERKLSVHIYNLGRKT